MAAATVVASTVYALLAITHGGLQPADITGILGLPLGVAGIVLAVMTMRKPVEGDAAELARQVKDGESQVWRQLLGDDNRRIDLTYVLHPTAVRRPAAAPAAGRLTAAGPGPATLPDVMTYYRSTRPLRLVVTGDAGAGKTVLALELLLALLDGRAEGEPVPVRIPLSRWDVERQSLPELLRQRLVESYDWPADQAADLVRRHMVLPVLDGLDEMDPPAADGTPDPTAPNATDVVQALNVYQRGRDAGPLILTCRTQHYDALAAHTEVLDAARIEIAPVATTDARNYLADRALGTARWQPLLDHLAAHPGGPLATMLSTPWRLCLTATVYHHEGDPAELLTLVGTDALDGHLLACYIPAVTRTAAGPERYSSQNVHRWLHHLTTRPHTAQASNTAGAADFALHELWPLAGRSRVRAVDALLSTLTALVPLPLAWPAIAPVFVVVLTTANALVVGAATFGTAEPRRLPSLREGSVRQRLLVLAATLAAGLTVGFTSGIGAGAVTGFAVGLVGASGLNRYPTSVASPRTVIRDDMLYGLVTGLATALATGLLTTLGVWHWLGFGLASALTLGAPLGLSAGIAAGLLSGAAARRYGVFVLCSRGRLPLRLARFLDWAAGTGGLLRYSGPAYQFRHRELEQWLSRHARSPIVP
ncbi:NACHT domain-containing protein [Streptomyces sp. NPDC093223]|uniref:NACHT domain-containing protein n=1 Tax=Streptomyces sp. NPDC093223 TaxID=3366033 RepID=UPI003817A508